MVSKTQEMPAMYIPNNNTTTGRSQTILTLDMN